jgi:hypothetical protein
MFFVFNNCIHHVCQLLYYTIVHTLYIHGTDMSVHVYAMWSGFQMLPSCHCDKQLIQALQQLSGITAGDWNIILETWIKTAPCCHGPQDSESELESSLAAQPPSLAAAKGTQAVEAPWQCQWHSGWHCNSPRLAAATESRVLWLGLTRL